MNEVIRKISSVCRRMIGVNRTDISDKIPDFCSKCNAKWIMLNPTSHPLAYCPNCGRLIERHSRLQKTKCRYKL